jgi:ethanolamine utilization microcompartment shell protein EutL
MTHQQEPNWLFPFEGMGIGDSFFIPTLKPAAMLYLVDNAAKRAQVRVKTYVTMKDGCLGVRTWRVA